MTQRIAESPPPPAGRLQPLLASLLCLGAAVAWYLELAEELFFLYLPPLVLAAAAILCHIRTPGPQMLARSAMWAILLLGALVAQLGNSAESLAGTLVAVGSGGALLLLGRWGLEVSSGRFRPIAYRGTLTAALTLAMADTLSLLFWAMAAFDALERGAGPLLLACAALMGVGVFGLYRLKIWGLVVNILANLLVAGLAASGALDLPSFVRALLIGTAILQLLVPIPLVVGLARNRLRPPSRAAARAGAVLATAAIALVMAAAVQPRLGTALARIVWP